METAIQEVPGAGGHVDIMQHLLDEVEKKVQNLRIFPRELWNVSKNRPEQTQNSFSGNSEILPLALPSLNESCQA